MLVSFSGRILVYGFFNHPVSTIRNKDVSNNNANFLIFTNLLNPDLKTNAQPNNPINICG
jgi:hypothetical protein